MDFVDASHLLSVGVAVPVTFVVSGFLRHLAFVEDVVLPERLLVEVAELYPLGRLGLLGDLLEVYARRVADVVSLV